MAIDDSNIANLKEINEPKSEVTKQQSQRGLSFWSVIFVINVAYFIACLEATAFATALPTIINDLQGGPLFLWVGSAYSIGTAAFMPIMGGMAQVFGRRPAMLAAIALFIIGSALTGAASSMSMMIGGRAVQGAGGAGLLSISTIILSDLVPLRERGTYNGVMQLTFCIASGIGPLVGGALASEGQWRWIYYLNLPFCGLAAILVLLFLHLKTPEGTIREKLARIDWLGTFIIVSSTVSLAIGLTWGGAIYAWSSAHVLVPLILGAIGIVFFFVFEAKWAKYPIVPYQIVSDRTALSGHLQNFLSQLPFITLIFYLPAYLQGVKAYSPIRAGVVGLGLAFSFAPFAVFSSVSIKILHIYRPQLWVGWVVTIVALALFSTITASTSLSTIVGYEFLSGVGGGIIFSGCYFPILAPTPLASMGLAVTLYSFMKQFAQIWGITIGGAILQNQMINHLATISSNITIEPGDITYQIIPLVQTLDQPLRGEVENAFVGSMTLIWKVMAGIAGLGLLSSLLMRHVPLHMFTDKNWGLQEDKEEVSEKRPEGPDNSAQVTEPIEITEQLPAVSD